MKRWGSLGLAGLVLTFSLAGCQKADDSDAVVSSEKRAEVRYKVSVTVDTPEGLHSGSSVWSWTLGRPTQALVSPYNGKFKGEAVAVDLPNGKTLFGLVKGQEMLPERQFRELRTRPRESEDRVADIRDIASNIGATKTLPCDERTGDERGVERVAYRFDCIMLVSFADLDDPTSVFEVDYHDAAASLGEGFAIRSVVVAITDEEVTTGIDKRLGWLDDYYDKMLDGQTTNDFSSFANNLSTADFWKGAR